jgi:hypothetical protein
MFSQFRKHGSAPADITNAVDEAKIGGLDVVPTGSERF